MPIRTSGFDHVHLWVDDLAAALRFYEDAFGARETFRVGEALAFVRFPTGEVIALDGRPEPERNPVHVGLRLAGEHDLDAAIDVIVRTGGVLLERGEHEPGVAYAYVADPDGNVLEL